MRLTISIRLSVIFGLVTALVLTLFGVYVYDQTRSDLIAAIDQGLQARARIIAAGTSHRLVTDTGVYGQPDEAFAQLMLATGAIIKSSGNTAGRPLLGSRQLKSVTAAAFFTRRPAGFDDPIRIFATRNRRGFTLVGETLGDTNDSLRQLARHYLAGAVVTLLGVILLGWLLLQAALRPVERMRLQASMISLDEGSGPLAVPRADDELGRLGRTLNSMLDRLRQSHARERRFIDYASHELRTPLTALRAEFDLALAHPRSATELTDAVVSAGDEVDRLIRLAENLLFLSNAEAPRTARVRLSDLVDSAVDAVKDRARSTGVTLTTSIPDVTAIGDPELLRQALANVLDNALRHAPPGSSVSVEATRQGSRVLLTVVDEGSGFPEPLLARVFEPFARGEPAGSGLGLAIVDAVAKAHGGTAVAGNAPGGGAFVTLDLAAS